MSFETIEQYAELKSRDESYRSHLANAKAHMQLADVDLTILQQNPKYNELGQERIGFYVASKTVIAAAERDLPPIPNS